MERKIREVLRVAGTGASQRMSRARTSTRQKKETTVPEVNAALRDAANRYLGYTEEPLVSIDFQGDPHSSIVDGSCTRVLGTTVKVMSWYDNEWGYSNRMLDLVLHMEANKAL